MAGVYIHIPFCRQACHYCDFHFSTNLTLQSEMVDAIVNELAYRSDYLNDPIDTIYFGGGTPSLLSSIQIEQVLASIDKAFDISENAEITLEANPEDLSEVQASAFKEVGVNRLSIGLQTFNDAKLKWMNRIHSSDQSRSAMENARKAGFKNISLDLIYAIPDHSHLDWEEDLKTIVELDPEHISLYGLTIEDKTVFGKWEREDKLIQLPEDEAAKQYLFAIEYLANENFVQYEVSNFGKAGFHSKHNNAYWRVVPYLGIGPGAHSFDGVSRRFNIRNNAKYIQAVKAGEIYWEEEKLSEIQRINETILTSLRTKEGLNLREINKQLQVSLEDQHRDFLESIRNQGLIKMKDGYLNLTANGFLVADEIALKLFFPE